MQASRRSFIKQAGATLAVGCLCACEGRPQSSPKISKVSLGPVLNFSAHKQVLPLERLMILKDEGGYAALHLVCTHQQCALNQAGTGFSCPCHGAQFSEQGKVLQGPANRDLPWLRMSLDSENNLLVHYGDFVSENWRLLALK